MSKFAKLSRAEMKNVLGGINPDQVFIYCSTPTGEKRELVTCNPCAGCNGPAEGFLRFADNYSCPSCA